VSPKGKVPAKGEIDASRIEFLKLTSQMDLSCLDCTEENGEDSQGLQKFIRECAWPQQEKHLNITYVIFYDKEPIGYITYAASGLHEQKMDTNSRPDAAIKTYPSVIIINLAITKSFRRIGFGDLVLIWFRGHARRLSTETGWRYIILFAREAIQFYEKNQFVVGLKQEDRDFKLMISDLFPDKV
jgi:hypothetical protein